MNKQCKFQVGKYNCGSYAFNLYKEQIDQKDRCDHHYWQEKAMEAAAHEREASITAIQNIERKGGWITREDAIEAITARGNT